MSVTMIDGDSLVKDLNMYRVSKSLRPFLHSGFLRELCSKHMRKIMRKETEYGLGDSEERRRAVSVNMENFHELMFKIGIHEDVLAYMLRHENSRKILEEDVNVVGCSCFELGKYLFVFLAFGRTF